MIFGKCKIFGDFLDEYTAMSTVYVLKEKSKIRNALSAYEAAVQIWNYLRMQSSWSDQADEQIGKHFKNYVREQGVFYSIL